MGTNVFVYGTLKRECCRGHIMDGQRFVGEVRTTPDFRMHNCGSYPGLVRVKEPGTGRSIVGELWEVDDDRLKILDQIEGVSFNLYRLEPITLQGQEENGPKVQAYLYQRSVARLPDCGECWHDQP